MFTKLKQAHNKLYLISTRLLKERQFNIIPKDNFHHLTEKKPSEGKISVQIKKKKSKKTPILDFGQLPLFKDVLFEFQDNLAKSTYLVGEFCRWNPSAILLQKDKGDKFKVSVSLDDEEVFYRFEVDGEIRLDPKYVNEIFITKDGLCSKINLNRYQKKVEIENKNNQRFCGKISASENWIKVDKQGITIPPDGREEIMVTILPDNMILGENTSVIRSDESKMKCAIKIQAEMWVHGIVPEIEERNFKVISDVEKGNKIRLHIKIVGQGILRGRISSHIGIIWEDILGENLTPTETTEEKDIIIDTQKLFTQGNEVKATLVTDSYIWNQRCFLLTFTFEGEMIHLKTSLPVLLFPQMTSGGKKKRLPLRITRSDDNRVDSSISIPENLSMYVKGHKLSENQWEIEFDPTKVNSEGIRHISGMIKITDKISNLEEQIPLIAEIGGNK